MKAINKNNLTEHLIEYQLQMVGLTTQMIKDDPNWFNNNTITLEQLKEFKSYALTMIKVVYRTNSYVNNKLYGWFILKYGLKLAD